MPLGSTAMPGADIAASWPLQCTARGHSGVVTLDIDTTLSIRHAWSSISDVQKPGWRIGVSYVSSKFELFFEMVNGWEAPTGTLVALWIGGQWHGGPITSMEKRCIVFSWQSYGAVAFLNAPNNQLKATIIIRFPDLTPQSLQPSRTIYATLNGFLDEDSPSDVHFHVFSRRMADRTVYGRRVISVLRKLVLQRCVSDIFSRLLNNDGFTAHDPVKQSVEEQTYDYDSDSDLEDEEQGSDEEDNATSKDSATEDQSVYATNDKHPIRSIAVSDGAYVTWKALCFYIYTGHITFAPLLSSGEEKRTKFLAKYARDYPGFAKPCSPESMFRLAEKYQISELQDMALAAIMNDLTPENVVQEFFSTVSLRYREVQEIGLEVLKENLANINTKAAWMLKAKEILRTENVPLMKLFFEHSAEVIFHLATEDQDHSSLDGDLRKPKEWAI